MSDVAIVLDDDRSFAEQVATGLRTTGFEAEAVRSIDEFKRAFWRMKPTLLILDIFLDKEDVCEAINFVSDAGYRAPVILVSGADFRARNLIGSFARDRGLFVTETADKKASIGKVLQLARSYRVRGAA